MAKKYQRQWEYSLEQTKQYVEHPKAPADGLEDGKRAVPTLGAEIPRPRIEVQ